MTRKHDALIGAPVNAEGKGDKRGRALSEWAESDDFRISDNAHITHRADAAAEGRALLTAALGEEELTAIIGRGRQSLDGTTGNGPSPKRQVRLPRDLDTLLDAQAERERRRSSEIIRDALDAYLRAS